MAAVRPPYNQPLQRPPVCDAGQPHPMIQRTLLCLLAALAPAGACDRRPPAANKTATPVSVLGISLHDPASSLAKHPTLKRIGDGMFADHAKGVEFGVTGDRVCYVLLRWDDPRIAFSDPTATAHGAFSGQFLVAGRQVSFTKAGREEDVVASLGEPYWRDVDKDEVLLFYEYPGLEVQVELTKDGPIRVLLARDDPLLADPKQRAAYRVTKAWPPTGG